MKTLELYQEPLKVLERFEHRGYTGMSDFDLAFLCGALKKFRPRKIVEVGVAAGGYDGGNLKLFKSLGLPV